MYMHHTLLYINDFMYLYTISLRIITLHTIFKKHNILKHIYLKF